MPFTTCPRVLLQFGIKKSSSTTQDLHQSVRPAPLLRSFWIFIVILAMCFTIVVIGIPYDQFTTDPLPTINSKQMTMLNHFTIQIEDTHLNCSHKTSWDYLWFQHVRKSGGSSIEGILRASNKLVDESIHGSYISNSHYYRFWFLGNDLKGLKARADAIHSKVISVEVQSFRVNELLQHPLRFHNVLLMTIIRDPIQRAWSDLNYPRTWRCAKKDTYMSCARRNRFWISDFNVRIFAGMIPKPYKTGHVNQEVIDNAEAVQQIHLDLSLLVLQQFDIVLILDQYETQRMQFESYGITNTTMQKKRVNFKKKKEEMTPELEEYLREINPFDLKFFEAAKRIAEERTLCAQSLLNSTKRKSPI